ncbi:hypothetical protein [Dankookia rubra]|uniref:hypothetical protein n=1 Tax=Dankookia rubra TaxID=1442381 RepID=UPI001F5036EB|nr:hypothetical protein [Dankookia rubra]
MHAILQINPRTRAAQNRQHATALVKVLARAFWYQRTPDDGRYAAISEMAARERIERGYLVSLLRLTLLAPDIVEAILNGQQPEGMTLPGLKRLFSVEWPQHSNARG